MTENVTGYAWRLEVGAASGTSLPVEGSETWSLVLDVEELTPPSPSREVQEWFVLDQPASKKIPGSITYSPCSATLTRAYGDTIQNRLEDDANSGSSVRRNYRIIASDTGLERRVWQGYCAKFEVQGVTNQDRAKIGIEIIVDGSVVITR
jgi:hypothetical protein